MKRARLRWIVTIVVAVTTGVLGPSVPTSTYSYDGVSLTGSPFQSPPSGSDADQRFLAASEDPAATERGYDDRSQVARASARPGGYRSAPNTAGIIRHGPMNPGPLADDVAGTFRSGTYNAVTSVEPTSLYRVYSDPARQLGPYWTRTRPSGPVQSIIDNALDPAWGNRATSWTQIRVPGGTTFYEGAAAAQRGLVGGGNQVFLPWVDDAWVVRSGGF